ncbi:MAG TPA: alpha-hydroxy-acid oxidizing protein [Deltaproteobacteria bacterium]|nr:alpha-hydroxy-acid oxidizing protein [Deltaproteobacteria bacterium]
MDPRLNLDDWEHEALEALDPMVAGYYVGGSRDEETLRGNRRAWSRWWLRHRVLTDVSHTDPGLELLGTRLSSPILAAPTAFHGLAHPGAEAETARGIAAAGGAMCLSTLSNTAVEEVVAAAAPAPVLFQLYVYRDRGATEAIVARARAAGCRALVVTVDAAVLGTRERDVRSGFHLPPTLSLPNAAPGAGSVPAATGASGLAAYVSEQLDPTLSWDDLGWLLQLTDLPVYAKGVVRGDDAARAASLGVAGVVVSNHGGRQLDGSIPTAFALPEVVEATDGRCPVWVDGGIRRGTDVVKALALGAQAVLIGRPVLWGLSVAGAGGVQAICSSLTAELAEAMALCGAPALDRLTPDLVRLAEPGL